MPSILLTARAHQPTPPVRTGFCWCANRSDGRRHEFLPGHGVGLCGVQPTPPEQAETEWTREDQEARTDRLRPLADHLRVGHDVPDAERRYRDTWLHIALLADEWFEDQTPPEQAEAAVERVRALLRADRIYVKSDDIRAALTPTAATQVSAALAVAQAAADKTRGSGGT